MFLTFLPVKKKKEKKTGTKWHNRYEDKNGFLIYGLTFPLMVVVLFEKDSGFYQNVFSFFFFLLNKGCFNLIKLNLQSATVLSSICLLIRMSVFFPSQKGQQTTLNIICDNFIILPKLYIFYK